MKRILGTIACLGLALALSAPVAAQTQTPNPEASSSGSSTGKGKMKLKKTQVIKKLNDPRPQERVQNGLAINPAANKSVGN